ncbi:hypothetical protein DI09_16p170 [Mitosporidium daphniae]|uniref:60S ribosomal protein L7 n=1 Tax=Mitosporidium daphniae TaxID=1485682 RepID=A0A098VTP5_9MICR|nr:uncharacterized protein DI09_16p170 [Mitosporidium daphniae]KGG52463.1 hypothetical protein DI09_16p170 [Mitosporidium daphniae]|eukprot:XP_013238890.1 uncharacterized protein DI09_16p170 [Mitosporidium daphniae]
MLRRIVENHAAMRLANRAAQLKKNRTMKKVAFKRAEDYAKEYIAKEREAITMKRESKASGKIYVPAESQLAFVVRIKGINKLSPKPRKILQLLRLIQINNGVFVRLTAATKKMLHLVEPYIAYGNPNLKSVKELIYKRGHGRIDKQRVALTDNKLIEAALGHLGIVCIEDLIHEIFTVGPAFKAANQFICPFKLSSPNGGFRARKFKHFIIGGDTGNREEFINDLIRKMN